MNRGLLAIAVITLSGGVALVMAAAPANAAGVGRDTKPHPVVTTEDSTVATDGTAATDGMDGGDLTTSLSGVPAQVPVDGGFTATVTVTSTSAYYVVVEDLYIGMWSLAQGFGQTNGITVSWDDPATGMWRQSDEVDPLGGWGLTPAGQVEIQPHGTLVYRVRVSMGADANQGIEHLDCNGVSAWTLVDASGNPAPGYSLLGYYQAQTSFTYGQTWRLGLMGGTTTPPVQTSQQAAAPVGPAQASESPRTSRAPAVPRPAPRGQGRSSSAAAAAVVRSSAPPPPSAVGPKAETTVTDASGNSVVPVAFVGLLIVTGVAAGTLSARRLRGRGDDDPDGR